MPVINQMGVKYQIIYVNDGSRDDTLKKLQSIGKNDKSVTILNLSRNFGKEIAITAGIFHSSGDAVIILDADGQHPPELIPEFLSRWQEGAQVVVGIRGSNEKEGFIKKYGSKLFYRLFNSASGAKIVPRSTDFRLLDRLVADEFITCSERNRITRGLIDWLGFDRSYVEFSSPARIAGTASYSTSQLIKLALDSFVSLSLRPLKILSTLGISITALAFLVGAGVFIEQIVLSDPLKFNFTGSAMLGILITFLVGLVITSQGVIATYLAHIYTQTQSRPLFVVNKKGSLNLHESYKSK
jgi:dolichol-phosphate mannosyltransferase